MRKQCFLKDMLNKQHEITTKNKKYFTFKQNRSVMLTVN